MMLDTTFEQRHIHYVLLTTMVPFHHLPATRTLNSHFTFLSRRYNLNARWK